MVYLTGSHIWNNLRDGLGPGTDCAATPEQNAYPRPTPISSRTTGTHVVMVLGTEPADRVEETVAGEIAIHSPNASCVIPTQTTIVSTCCEPISSWMALPPTKMHTRRLAEAAGFLPGLFEGLPRIRRDQLTSRDRSST